MNFVEYSPRALVTAKPLPHKEQVDHALLGMITEMGEFADCVKSYIIRGKPFDEVNAGEELADICWYLNLYCHEKRIHPAVLDDALAETKLAETKYDKAALMKATLLLASMINGALLIDDVGIRGGVTDQQVVVEAIHIMALVAAISNVDIYTFLERNILKLEDRYKSGKFTEAESIARNTAAERVILEGGNG